MAKVVGMHVKNLLLLCCSLMVLICASNVLARKAKPEVPVQQAEHVVVADAKPLQCVAFSPYVDKLTPDYGSHPSKELIDHLLDRLIEQTPFRCIMTYGVLNGLDVIFASAEAKKIKVIAILWIDKDVEVNSQSITKGIEVAKAYPQTIIKLSCGSEVQTRHEYQFDGEINRCIDSLRKAGVKQPITTIDTWWEWCNRSNPCQPTSFKDSVDWIGVNIFPWWENKHSGVHSCTSAEKAADFHIARLEEIHKIYPDKELVMTEFGWPSAPEGGSEKNKRTGEACGVASRENQKMIIRDTFKKLKEHHWSGVVFEAFSESWKPSNEGDFGNYWGICRGAWPYGCTDDILGTESAGKK